MVKEKDALSELEQNQIKDNTNQILENIRNEPAVPIKLRITGQGEKGKQELSSLLEVLEKLRDVKYLGGLVNNETQIVNAEILRETGYYDPYSKTDDWLEKYEAEGGVIAQISNRKGVIEVSLKENLERGGKNILGGLINLLRIWTDAEELSFDPLRKLNGEILGTEIIMQIKELKPVTDLEEKLLGEIQLYQNMKNSLFKTMKDIERQRRLNPKKLLDNIGFYTNFGSADLKELEKWTKLACFLREVYGIMQAENNVTVNMVKSNLKSRIIVANRSALMFLCRKKFPWLSSSNIGKILSRYGRRPKNHATVLMSCKRFNTRTKGIKVKNYPNEDYAAKELLEDSEKRHLAYLIRKDKEKYKNYTIEDIFKLRSK